jgi:hypothetical protein
VAGYCEHGNEPSVLKKCLETFLSSYATESFSRRTQLHGVSLILEWLVITEYVSFESNKWPRINVCTTELSKLTLVRELTP